MPKATQMIRQDHKKVEGLFKKFEQTNGAQAKRRLAENAMEEHQTVKRLISELKGMAEADDEFESRFSQLVENVQHHVEEEENEMLPKVEESELDLNSLGEQMTQRKQKMQNGGRATKKASNARTSPKNARSKSTARKAAAK